MQAIETKYMAPTNYLGTRIKAQCAARTIIYNWNYELDVTENHHEAAKKLVKLLDWPVKVSSGCLKNGNYVHVLTGKKRKV